MPQRSFLALASLTLLALVAGSVDSSPQSGVAGNPVLAPSPSGCDELWRHEPLLVFDESGNNLAGPLSVHLSVYNDGSVVFSRFYLFAPEREAEAVTLPPELGRGLLHDLREASAFQLCDQPAFATDTTLKTLTVFGGGTEARAHTISWWIGQGPYGALEEIVRAFLDEHFPQR